MTVRLSEEMNQALAEAAKGARRKRAEIVRLALSRFLDPEPAGSAVERVPPLLGTIDSGIPDLAENHRQYVLESLRRGP